MALNIFSQSTFPLNHNVTELNLNTTFLTNHTTPLTTVEIVNVTTDRLNLINTNSLFVLSPYALSIAGLCAILATVITIHQIYLHLKNYTCVVEQRYIIRILLIVPAYGLYAFISVLLAVHAKVDSIYIDFMHDIAEAFAIYSFLALCYQYLGGEGNIMLELTGKTIKSSLFYGTCCFAGRPYTILFLRFCKIATLQYTLIKPITSLTSVILVVCNKYTIGNFSPTSGYLYLFLINNITVTLALYGLLLFYFATRDQLKPFSPVLKFATIKAIIFVSFWQDVLFSILQWSHVISQVGDYSPALISGAYRNFLICIELVLVAISLRYAFPYSIYVLHRPPRLVFDVPSDGWFVNGDDIAIDFKIAQKSSIVDAVKTDPRFNHANFAHHLPSYVEPLPWDAVQTPSSKENGSKAAWNHPTNNIIPSISAGIKATIDPTDILVDAVHNFHPIYRHYTQTKIDDES